MKHALLVIAGAAIGGTLGYFAFFWIADQGFYGLVVPGGLLGIGAGLARKCSLPLALACGAAAVALGIVTEWQYRPFLADESFSYFLFHILDKRPLKLVMIALGGFVGFWVPYRRQEPTQKNETRHDG